MNAPVPTASLTNRLNLIPNAVFFGWLIAVAGRFLVTKIFALAVTLQASMRVVGIEMRADRLQSPERLHALTRMSQSHMGITLGQVHALNTAMLVAEVIFVVAGAFVAAHLARRHPLHNAVAVGSLTFATYMLLLLANFVMLQMMRPLLASLSVPIPQVNRGPSPFLHLIVFPLSLLGGYLRMVTRSPEAVSERPPNPSRDQLGPPPAPR